MQAHVAGEKLFVDYAGTTIDIFDATTGEVHACQLSARAFAAPLLLVELPELLRARLLDSSVTLTMAERGHIAHDWHPKPRKGKRGARARRPAMLAPVEALEMARFYIWKAFHGRAQAKPRHAARTLARVRVRFLRIRQLTQDEVGGMDARSARRCDPAMRAKRTKVKGIAAKFVNSPGHRITARQPPLHSDPGMSSNADPAA